MEFCNAGGNMKENEMGILDQYDINVKSTRKARDGVLCETEQGLFLVKELRFSEKRLSVLEYLGEYLRSRGCENIDWILKNKDNQLFCTSEEGNRYFLKKWFPGKECDIHREKDVLDAVVNLTKLHCAMVGFGGHNVSGEIAEPIIEEETPQISQGEDLREEYFRHNREMKKVRSFVRERAPKSDFELAYLKHFNAMYSSAEDALEQLKSSEYEKLRVQVQEKHTLIHGDYNYHNVLMTYCGVATTNFEHVQENIQVTDLYYFMRKVMEKNRWDPILGDKMLNCYQRYVPLKPEEIKYIAICLAYPEKFWKVANSYSRSRKVLLPAKNLEKLELVVRQHEEKKEFLKTIFAFHLS
jgi:spore coat protein I